MDFNPKLSVLCEVPVPISVFRSVPSLFAYTNVYNLCDVLSPNCNHLALLLLHVFFKNRCAYLVISHIFISTSHTENVQSKYAIRLLHFNINLDPILLANIHLARWKGEKGQSTYQRECCSVPIQQVLYMQQDDFRRNIVVFEKSQLPFDHATPAAVANHGPKTASFQGINLTKQQMSDESDVSQNGWRRIQVDEWMKRNYPDLRSSPCWRWCLVRCHQAICRWHHRKRLCWSLGALAG